MCYHLTASPSPLLNSGISPLTGSVMGGTMMGTGIMPGVLPGVLPGGVMSPMMGSTIATGGMLPGTMAPMMGTGMMRSGMMGTGMLGSGLMGGGMMGTGLGGTMMGTGIAPALNVGDMGTTLPPPSSFLSGTPAVVTANLQMPGGTPLMISQMTGSRRIPIIKRQYFTKNWFSCLDQPGFQTECYPPRLI